MYQSTFTLVKDPRWVCEILGVILTSVFLILHKSGNSQKPTNTFSCKFKWDYIV